MVYKYFIEGMKMKRKTITTKEAAEILGCSVWTLYSWSSKGGPITPVERGNHEPLGWSKFEVKALAKEMGR